MGKQTSPEVAVPPEVALSGSSTVRMSNRLQLGCQLSKVAVNYLRDSSYQFNGGVFGLIWSLSELLWHPFWRGGVWWESIKTTILMYHNEATGYCRVVVIGENSCVSPGVFRAVWNLVSALLPVLKHFLPALV